MNKIIVTGGNGFIGSNLIKFLLNKNFFVINIDKVTYSSNFYNVKKFSKNKNYKFGQKPFNLKMIEKIYELSYAAAEDNPEIETPLEFYNNNGSLHTRMNSYKIECQISSGVDQGDNKWYPNYNIRCFIKYTDVDNNVKLKPLETKYYENIINSFYQKVQN